jgi:hypothetical protein
VRVFAATAIEIVRLAVAVLLYTVWEPALVKLVPEVPIIGESIAALLAAGVVLLASWIFVPVGRVVVDVERYANSVPYPGPTLDLPCTSHTKLVATYGLKVRYERFGLIAEWAANGLAKRGVQVAFLINSRQLILHSEDVAADEEQLDRGVVVTLNDSPTDTTWEYVTVTVDSAEVPQHLDVDVKTRLLYPAGKPWYVFTMWSTSNIKKIVLMNNEGHP